MKLKLVEFKREPKKCICPGCGLKQRFKSNGRYFKTIKDLSMDKPLKLKAEVLRAKCLNQACSLKSFTR
ncbi:MAG: hypothetical protein B1H08_00615 [Candidatus Omnitrophica bacterium 4484_171]|nr:MAG: hypothetical protein B1H08_00615 [Candidatus Omnitrophica bacterium 4484_171]